MTVAGAADTVDRLVADISIRVGDAFVRIVVVRILVLDLLGHLDTSLGLHGVDALGDVRPVDAVGDADAVQDLLAHTPHALRLDRELGHDLDGHSFDRGLEAYGELRVEHQGEEVVVIQVAHHDDRHFVPLHNVELDDRAVLVSHELGDGIEESPQAEAALRALHSLDGHGARVDDRTCAQRTALNAAHADTDHDLAGGLVDDFVGGEGIQSLDEVPLVHPQIFHQDEHERAAVVLVDALGGGDDRVFGAGLQHVCALDGHGPGAAEDSLDGLLAPGLGPGHEGRGELERVALASLHEDGELDDGVLRTLGEGEGAWSASLGMHLRSPDVAIL